MYHAVPPVLKAGGAAGYRDFNPLVIITDQAVYFGTNLVKWLRLCQGDKFHTIATTTYTDPRSCTVAVVNSELATCTAYRAFTLEVIFSGYRRQTEVL